MVSDEYVEKAARAIWEVCWLGDWEDAQRFQRAACRDEARVALLAALPVIERDLRETIARDIEATDAAGQAWSRSLVRFLAARVREGGRA